MSHLIRLPEDNMLLHKIKNVWKKNPTLIGLEKNNTKKQTNNKISVIFQVKNNYKNNKIYHWLQNINIKININTY